VDASAERVLEGLLSVTDSAVVGSYSAVLYGSAARGQYVPKHSDLNLLLVLERVTPDLLRSLGKGLGAWRRAGHPPPVLMSRVEWSRAVDAFPLEVADMKTAYRVLRGNDPLAGVQVPPADLRRAIEREFRGKVLQLRRGYALAHDDPEALATVARASVAGVLLLLRGLLLLAGQEVPNDPLVLINRAAPLARFSPDAMAEIAERRGDHKWRCPAPLFLEYLAALEAAERYVDQLEPGGKS
jgi:predicted nucleotidyltransferase